MQDHEEESGNVLAKNYPNIIHTLEKVNVDQEYIYGDSTDDDIEEKKGH